MLRSAAKMLRTDTSVTRLLLPPITALDHGGASAELGGGGGYCSGINSRLLLPEWCQSLLLHPGLDGPQHDGQIG